jgi:putative transposase
MMGIKKRKGRKGTILTDLKGNIHCLKYFPANTNEVETARGLVQNYRLTPFGKNNKQKVSILADKGFHSPSLKQYCQKFNISILALIRQKKPDTTTKVGQDIFKQQYGYLSNFIKSLRWIVERTFAWLQKYRRLNLNYERTINSFESMTLLAAIHIKLRSG